MTRLKAAIRAISSYLPPSRVTNSDLEREAPEWNVDKIRKKTGIDVRHVAAAGETALDLGCAATRRLFETARLAPTDVDFVLFCTQSPDYFLPTSACLLQHRLGIPTSAGAFDFNLGCSGFVYGLSVAKGLIETGQARSVLLVTAETYSKFLAQDDRSVRTIFGDGAAATLVQATAVDGDTEPLGPFVFGTDGGGAANLIVARGGAREPVGASGDKPTLYMNGPEIFNFTLNAVPQCVASLLERARLSQGDVDQFFFHQANKFMLEALRAKMKIAPDRFCVNLETYGNTVSATIPMAVEKYAEVTRDAPLPAKVALVGFGVGYSWGACIADLRHLARRAAT